ncbi:MAG TPA: BspA family leucine-rich repeat surface protein, partial [Cyclobacteriaceae bacterium]|nr:BspA family leucine-rich repeat surface protein [Cyclobacteriaceae bacterium]
MQQRFQTASLLGPLLFLSVLASAQPFITNWVPADTDITIPTNPAFAGSYDYSYTITNISGVGGDASSSGETSTVIISGLTPGDTYRVEISGDFPSIYFNNNTAISSELISIEQWGAIAWQSMFRAFSSCSNLQLNATDQPDFTNTTDLSFMFLNASTVDADISDWDVSTITNMSGMFNGATNFNNGGQPLDWANTGLVQNMSSMFTLTSSFNQDVSGWDVSSVTTMRSMFAVATGFNNGGQPLDWVNTGMLATTQFMFFDATSFDQSLGTWDIGNVTNMSNMLDNSAMSVANYDATLIGWEAQAPGNVVTLGATGLQFCSAATAHANLMSTYGWTINDAGLNCTLVPFITTWQTDNPGSSSANQITIPTTGAGYNYDVSWFEVGNPANNGTSFGATSDLTIDFPAPGTYRVEITGQFPRIFFNAASFSSNKDSQKILTIEQWGSIAWTSMASAFAGCENLVINAADAPDLSGVTDLSSMFREAYVLNSNISHWDVSTITNMSRMFRDATLFNQPLNSWDVSGVTDMSEMFFFASVFNQNLNNWQVDNVTNMDSMFGGALAFNGDVSTWHVDNVTDLSGMFSVAEAFNGDISGWQITSPTNLSGMFNG